MEDRGVDMDLLEEAFSLPSGGGQFAPSYYALSINGREFRGCRDWEERWTMLADAMDYRGKRILELGCNIGLASKFLMRYRGAASALGVDSPQEVLDRKGMPDQLKAARLLDRAFDVEMDYLQVDLDGDGYEDAVGDGFDVVICMSLLRWVKDKERLVRFMARFPDLIFEGHGSFEESLPLLERHGFVHHEFCGTKYAGWVFPERDVRSVVHLWKGDEK